MLCISKLHQNKADGAFAQLFDYYGNRVVSQLRIRLRQIIYLSVKQSPKLFYSSGQAHEACPDGLVKSSV